MLLLIGLVEEAEEKVSRGWGHMRSKIKKARSRTLEILAGDAC